MATKLTTVYWDTEGCKLALTQTSEKNKEIKTDKQTDRNLTTKVKKKHFTIYDHKTIIAHKNLIKIKLIDKIYWAQKQQLVMYIIILQKIWQFEN